MVDLVPECIVAGEAEAPEPPEAQILEELEVLVVPSPQALLAWSRIVRGILTISKLKGFFGVLGTYLKEVKRRGSDGL